MTLQKPLSDRKIVIALGSFLIFFALFVLLACFPPYRGMGIAYIIPCIAMGWLYGLYAGLITGLLSPLFCIPLCVALGLDWVTYWYAGGVGIVGMLLQAAVGGIVGKLHDYHNRLGRELADRIRLERELEKHRDHLNELVIERTAKLTAANEALRAREEELEALNEELIAQERQLHAANLELRAANQQLQTSQADLLKTSRLLENTFQASVDGLVISDMEGRIIRANTAIARLLGCTLEDLRGRHMAELVPRETPYIRIASEFMATLLEHGVVKTMETCLLDVNGTLHPVELNAAYMLDQEGMRSGAIISIKDIAQKKKAEEEMLRLAAAVEHAEESIAITDPAGCYIYANPSFEHVSGYSRREILGRHMDTLTVAEGAGGILHEMSVCRAGGASWRGRLTRRKKNGGTYEALVIISPIKDQSGAVMNYVTIERDVTRELETERYLRQSQKMEAIGTLAGGIAHDFNNILSVIIGYTDLACKNVAPDSKIKSWLDQIFKAAERARTLVRQILTFSRRGELERKPVQMHLVVKEALKLLRATIPSTIEIREHIDTAAGLVIADPTELHQVLMNLCTNATHAMEEHGGVLTVSLGPVTVTREESASYPDLVPGPYISLRVSDTGAGIAPEIIDKIFDPFFTTKVPGKGTGMGLSVVHGIVKNSGGDITVKSTPGNGAVFEVVLPRVVDEVVETQETLTPLPTGTEHILFVDDEELVTSISQEMLRTLGYTVTAFSDSMQALACFRNSPETFDLIITDQTMPHMTGYELAGNIAAIRPDIPVILCTGFSETLQDKKIEISSIKALVMKPMNLRELAETIRSVLDGTAKK